MHTTKGLQGRRGNAAFGRLIALMIVVAVVAGALGGYALYRLAPQSLAHALAPLRRTPTPAPTGTPTSGTGKATVAPNDTAAMFQQMDQALTSYQEQPIDAHSGLRLVISKLGINAPIVERGIVQGWMVVAPGDNVTHFVYSSYPGADGNAIMYSHAGTVFRHLDSLAVNDTIIVQTPSGALQFRVRELRIVSPTSLAVLDATPTPVLTLLTCYPFGVDSSRLAVIADLMQS
jgi:sortase A